MSMTYSIAAACAPDCAMRPTSDFPLLVGQAVQPPMPPAGKPGARAANFMFEKMTPNARSAEIMNKIEEYKKEKDGLDVGRRRLKSKQV
jgi:hypothetical protein